MLRLGPPRFAVYGANQDTNTWAPWYVQHKIVRGLLDAYSLTGNQRAYEIAVKMADWAHLALTLGDVTHPDYAGPIARDDLNLMWDTYIAGEYGGANEVFAEIAALTGEAKHLETAQAASTTASRCSAPASRTATSSSARPGPSRAASARRGCTPIRTCPNFTGYMRVFERTGEPEYRAAAKNFFGMVVPHRMYAHGGTSGNYPGSNNNVEMFQNRDNIANSIAADGAETCTTYNLMKLARNLFFHEPEPAYMDYVERGAPESDRGLARRQHEHVESAGDVLPAADAGPQPRLRQHRHLLRRHRPREPHQAPGIDLLPLRRRVDAVGQPVRVLGAVVAGTRLHHHAGDRLPARAGDEAHGRRPRAAHHPAAGAGVGHERATSSRINGRLENVRDEPGTYVNLRRRWVAWGHDRDHDAVQHPDRARARPAGHAVGLLRARCCCRSSATRAAGSYRELTLYRQLKRDGDYSRAAITPAGGQTFTAQGLTLRPHYVGDAQPHSPYFRRVEPAIVFGSIDAGVPNYKRNDGLPNYDVPVEGIPSPPTDGLTFLDIVWDQAPFKNHGAFVSMVEWTAYEFLQAGRFTALRTRSRSAGRRAGEPGAAPLM